MGPRCGDNRRSAIRRPRNAPQDHHKACSPKKILEAVLFLEQKPNSKPSEQSFSRVENAATSNPPETVNQVSEPLTKNIGDDQEQEEVNLSINGEVGHNYNTVDVSEAEGSFSAVDGLGVDPECSDKLSDCTEDGRPKKRRNVSIRSATRSIEHFNSLSSGTARGILGSSDGTCDCDPLLQRVMERLPEAVLSKNEQKRRKRKYSYARLSTIVLNMAFDASANWAVHRKCLMKILPVSGRWLSDRHQEARILAHVPIETFSKAEIASANTRRMRQLIEHIILPEDCVLSPKRYFESQGMDFQFKVSRLSQSLHGNIGRQSNRARTLERDHFRMFVVAHRQPSGRTIHKDGRSHGAMFYLDAVFDSIRNKEDDIGQSKTSVADVFNVALREGWDRMSSVKVFKPVAGSTLDTWMKEDFGSVSYRDGKRIPSDQFTTIYPHKTDACARCETLKASLRSLEQQRKRHKQQHDQGSLLRREALAEIENEMVDTEEELKCHRMEADAAIHNHRKCIDDAFTNYCSVSDRFYNMLTVARDGSTSAFQKESVIDKFIEEASCLWVQISSDYQQDKSIPRWNKSPQPGPTYYMSGLTHYVHIFCIDSLGLSTGQSRMQRNRVYTRCEEIGGSKCGDDTLSTFSDVLLGYTAPLCDQPTMFRTGYDEHGKIIDLT